MSPHPPHTCSPLQSQLHTKLLILLFHHMCWSFVCEFGLKFWSPVLRLHIPSSLLCLPHRHLCASQFLVVPPCPFIIALLVLYHKCLSGSWHQLLCPWGSHCVDSFAFGSGLLQLYVALYLRLLLALFTPALSWLPLASVCCLEASALSCLGFYRNVGAHNYYTVNVTTDRFLDWPTNVQLMADPITKLWEHLSLRYSLLIL